MPRLDHKAPLKKVLVYHPIEAGKVMSEGGFFFFAKAKYHPYFLHWSSKSERKKKKKFKQNSRKFKRMQKKIKNHGNRSDAREDDKLIYFIFFMGPNVGRYNVVFQI